METALGLYAERGGHNILCYSICLFVVDFCPSACQLFGQLFRLTLINCFFLLFFFALRMNRDGYHLKVLIATVYSIPEFWYHYKEIFFLDNSLLRNTIMFFQAKVVKC